jgi:hypothetical protein
MRPEADHNVPEGTRRAESNLSIDKQTLSGELRLQAAPTA